MSIPRLIGTVDPVRSGAPDSRLLVLGPSLGTTTDLWAQLVPRLASTHRVLRFDLPGHGASPGERKPFSVADLAEGVVRLVDSIGGGAFDYAGISLGGAIGLQLALRHPERLSSLSVICSGARIGTAQSWTDRAAGVRAAGTASVVTSSAARWFAAGFIEHAPELAARSFGRLVDVDDESYALCCEALAAFDTRASLGAITTRTLCVAGEFDQPTPLAGLEAMADEIPGATFSLLRGAAHLPAYERPDELGELLVAHLQAADTRGDRSSYDAGLAVRRQVLGDEHVDRALSAITPETADFQDFITRFAWGEIWTRPGLDRRSRSLLTLACLVTGGHEKELALHIRAALANGLSRAEISEALLHTSIYAGVPAANSAFSVLSEALSALDAANRASSHPEPAHPHPTADPSL